MTDKPCPALWGGMGPAGTGIEWRGTGMHPPIGRILSPGLDRLAVSLPASDANFGFTIVFRYPRFSTRLPAVVRAVLTRRVLSNVWEELPGPQEFLARARVSRPGGPAQFGYDIG